MQIVLNKYFITYNNNHELIYIYKLKILIYNYNYCVKINNCENMINKKNNN